MELHTATCCKHLQEVDNSLARTKKSPLKLAGRHDPATGPGTEVALGSYGDALGR